MFLYVFYTIFSSTVLPFNKSLFYCHILALTMFLHKKMCSLTKNHKLQKLLVLHISQIVRIYCRPSIFFYFRPSRVSQCVCFVCLSICLFSYLFLCLVVCTFVGILIMSVCLSVCVFGQFVLVSLKLVKTERLIDAFKFGPQ